MVRSFRMHELIGKRIDLNFFTGKEKNSAGQSHCALECEVPLLLVFLLATQLLRRSEAVLPPCSVIAMAVMGVCVASSFWGSGSRVRDLTNLLNWHSSSSAVNALAKQTSM